MQSAGRQSTRQSAGWQSAGQSAGPVSSDEQPGTKQPRTDNDTTTPPPPQRTEVVQTANWAVDDYRHGVLSEEDLTRILSVLSSFCPEVPLNLLPLENKERLAVRMCPRLAVQLAVQTLKSQHDDELRATLCLLL